MALAAGLPTIFQDREDMQPKGLRATDTTETSFLRTLDWLVRTPWSPVNGRSVLCSSNVKTARW